MGYSTDFSGVLEFVNPLTDDELSTLDSILEEDSREHKEWGNPGVFFIDLCLTEDAGGLEWNGAEKTNYMDNIINLVIREMRKRHPEFGLTGCLKAQGENPDDRYYIVVDETGARKKTPDDITNEYEVRHKSGSFAPDAEYFVLRLDGGSNYQDAAIAAIKAYAQTLKDREPNTANMLLNKYGNT